MGASIYTAEELEKLQLALFGLLCYARRHDRRELPPCFGACERIVRNIDLCRSGGYTELDRAELSQLIREDWRSAMELHSGLPEYYIPEERMEIQRSMNHALHRQVEVVDRLVAAGERRWREIEP